VRTTRSALLAAGIALGFAVLGSGNASAATITGSGSLILNNGNTLGAGDYGTVTYNFLSGTAVSFDIQLNSGYQFVHTGFDSVFAFTTNTAIVIGPTPPSLIIGNGTGTWSGVGDGTGTSISMDGAGNFGGGVTNSLSGGNNLLGNDIKFTISGAATLLALENAIKSGGQDLANFFAADICVLAAGSTTSCAATGVVYDDPPSTVPLPPAVFLFGTALAGLGVLGRRRRSNAQA
jgi:hypothetical protein